MIEFSMGIILGIGLMVLLLLFYSHRGEAIMSTTERRHQEMVYIFKTGHAIMRENGEAILRIAQTLEQHEPQMVTGPEHVPLSIVLKPSGSMEE